jgi:WD40 repeat protein
VSDLRRFVIEDRGTTAALDAYVVGVAVARAPGSPAAWALGDGTVRLLDPASREWRSVPVHEGAVLAFAAAPGGFVTGGDDGRFCRVGPDGAVQEIAKLGGRWVEQVAAYGDTQGGKGGLLACAAGKIAHVFDAGGQGHNTKLKQLTHPSTVTGLAFDGKGKRLGAAHYNGASLWFIAAKEDKPRVLEWKGSHTGIAIHPGGEAAVTTMQENALHGWRLADGQHMRMSGYPAKTESLSFSRTGKWLASSGADTVVLWPFFGGGPMGKPPVELAGGDGVLCSSVAFHPQSDMVAAGFTDGLVVLADVATERVLPIAPPGKGAITALAWAADGTSLIFGTDQGFAALIDLRKQ